MDKIQSALTLRLCARMMKSSAKGFHFGPHQHPFHELGVVLSGQCVWTLRQKKKMTLNRGDILLLPPGVVHQEDVDGNSRGLVMWVGFEAEGRDLASLSLKKVEACDMEQTENLLQWIEREWNSPRADSHMLSGNALEMLLVLMKRSVSGIRPRQNRKPRLNTRQSRIVQAARSYFEQNPGIPFSVEQIARYHSLSVSHFSALFRKELGIGPRDFVQKLRIRETTRWLKTSDLPLKEIAMKYGYVDPAHFCRHFKKETGMSPGQFRRQQNRSVRL